MIARRSLLFGTPYGYRVMRIMVLFILLLSMLAASLVSVERARAATLTVGDGTDGSCTEVAFDTQLALAGDTDTIDFNCGPTDGPIVFTDWKVIDIVLTIDGGNAVTLSGGQTTAIFHVDLTGNLTLQNITLTDGMSDGDQEAGAILNEGMLTVIDSTISNSNAGIWDGGAIENYGVVTLTRATVSGNQADYGGGLDNYGTATVTDSLFDGNSGASGGAIFNWDVSTLTITGTSIVNNVGVEDSGGVANDGVLDIDTSTIAENVAIFGGGIITAYEATITNSTISGNSGFYAGAVLNSGELSIVNSTISGNESEALGAILNESDCLCDVSGRDSLNATEGAPAWMRGGIEKRGQRAGTRESLEPLSHVAGLSLAATTVADNDVTAGAAIESYGPVAIVGTLVSNPGADDNCAFDVPSISQGYNLSTDLSCDLGDPTDLEGVAAGILALASNGGPTQTHALEATSLAVDGGPATGCGPADQRGETRPQGNACDIGAFESSFFRDTAKPTTTTPAWTFNRPGIGTEFVGIEFSWTGSDTGGGTIASYDIRRRAVGNVWGAPQPIASTLEDMTHSLWFRAGQTYEVSVRAIDSEGNVGDWSTAASFTLSVVEDDDAAVAFAGPSDWTERTGAHFSGGSARMTTTAGATVTYVNFTGNTIAWIGSINQTSGQATVQIDAGPAVTVDLSSVKPMTRRAIFTASGLSEGQHTLTITTQGTQRITVDAFVVID